MATTNPSDLADGDIVAEAWVDAVAQHVIRVFASTAARDAELTSPHVGQLVHIASNDASEGLYEYTSAGTWRKMWNMPGGEQGTPAAYTTIQSGIGSSVADLTGLTVTFTAGANRVYYVHGRVYLEKATTADTVFLGVYDGGNALKDSVHNDKHAAADLWVATIFGRVTGLSAGSQTLKLRGSTPSGTFNVRSDALTGRLAVFDAGPAGIPA